jgi:CDP-glycerol glycerophosphotransferase (TagB/SpsB family)
MDHRDRTHVWLNHGDSDKPANFNPRHALYDVLVVCGQAGIDRYARHGIHVEPEKFRVLGRPQASGVKPAKGPIAGRRPKRVLYAPTWHGLDETVNFSSLERGPEIVRALIQRDVTVIFRPHPLSYRWRRRAAVIQEIREILRADRNSSDRRHRWGNTVDHVWSVVDCTNRADALISDVSSVVSDFLQSEKPYAMTSMRAGVEEFREEFSVAETGYVLLGDLSNLDQVLDDLLEADPLAAARAERKRYVLGDFVGDESADAFAGFVRDLVRGG